VLVYSASAEQTVLAERADVVVDGPDGVAAWLSRLADALEGA
jgi:trehalose 6-phosphate phosphatase